MNPIYNKLIILAFLPLSMWIYGCGGHFSRLNIGGENNDSPQPFLEEQYHKSDYWGGKKGIYVSVRKKSSTIGRQKYIRIKLMNYSGNYLLLESEKDSYWFDRYGKHYSLYRRPGDRYPSRISDKRHVEFDLLGIESFTNVDSVVFLFSEMDSLSIAARLK